jgi:hypothetical protein
MKAAAIAQLFELQRRATETTELAARLEALEAAQGESAMTRALHRRLLRLEQAARASDAVKAVTRPAGLEGEELAEWERANLSDRGDYGLVVVINKFSEPDEPVVRRRHLDAQGCDRVHRLTTQLGPSC